MCAGNKIRSSFGFVQAEECQAAPAHHIPASSAVRGAPDVLGEGRAGCNCPPDASHEQVPGGLSEIAASLKLNRQRLLKMQFCLAESHRHYVRLFLKKAKCIVLHADAKGGRLVTRFSATAARLRHLRGTLPFQKDHNSIAKGLAAAMQQSLTDLCTPYVGAKPSCG